MECGELSVMEGTGTSGMLLWHAGSCSTSMKVSTLIPAFNLLNTCHMTSMLPK